MKYTTIEYDANRPSAKQIAVPLNSEYGVEVEVCKNGEKLPLVSSDLSVGEYTGETINGFTCVQLSSGSEPGRTEYDVSVKDIDGKFKLIVQQKDMGYFDIPRFQPEPEPPVPPTLLLSAFAEVPAHGIASTGPIEAEYEVLTESGAEWVEASAVVAFTCVTQIEGEDPVEHDDFMKVNVQDAAEDNYWFTKPGDPDYGDLWYEAEGGEGQTKANIKLRTGMTCRLLHFEQPADKSVTIEFKLYVRSEPDALSE